MGKIEHRWIRVFRGLLLPLGLAAGVVFFAAALDNLDRGQAEKGVDQLEQALRRGCVACFASEGSYPPSLEYLEEHYGIQVDEDRYMVHYVPCAENLMPDITVLERP